MALRSPALFMGNPAINHTAQNDRLSKAGMLRAETGQTASNRPLTAASGVLQGPPGTMGEVTLLSNTQFTVNPARWMLQSSDSPTGGAYEVTNDAVETRTITAQDAALYRRSYWGVWVIDSFVVGSGDDLPHWGLIDGPLAASNPQLPLASVLPENFLALGEFSIPPTGQAVTYTAYSVVTGLRGGIVPVSGSDTRNGVYDGQVRDFPLKSATNPQAGGPQRWSVSAVKWQALSVLDFPVALARQVTTQNTLPSGWNTITLDTVEFDTHGGWSGGAYTIPTGQGGIYRLTGAVAFGPVGIANLYYGAEFTINGAPPNAAIGNFFAQNSTTQGVVANAGARPYQLNAGDVIRLRGYLNGANWATQSATDGASWAAVERIR